MEANPGLDPRMRRQQAIVTPEALLFINTGNLVFMALFSYHYVLVKLV